MVDGPVLVTGVAGLVGQWLVRTAPADREIVGVVHRRAVPGLRTVAADLRDSVATREVVGRVRPALVVHTAYAKDRASIVDATRHVVDAAVDVGADVVHLSSDVVFPGDGRSRDEASAPAPTSDYGRWKAIAEQLVTAAAIGASVVRLSLVVSIDPDDAAVASIRAAAARGERTVWFTDELRQPARADDLARAVWSIAALDRGARVGAWHLPGPETLSRYEIATRVVAQLGLDPEVVVGNTTPAGSDRPRHLQLEDGRARRKIGWSPAPVLR